MTHAEECSVRNESCASFPFLRRWRRNAVLLIAGTLAATPAATASQASEPPEVRTPTALTRVEVLDAPHATAVHLHLDGAAPGVTSTVLEDPERLVIELHGVADETETPLIEVGSLRAARVRLEPREGGVAIVIEAGGAVDPFQNRGISPTDDGLLVTVGFGPVVAREPAPGVPAPVAGAGAAGEGTGVAEAAEPPAPLPPVAAEGEGAGAEASAAMPQATRADGLEFEVQEFVLEYARDHPDHPPLDEILAIEVELGRVERGYVAPRAGVPVERVRLADVPRAPVQRFYGSAIRAIDESIVAEFNRRGLAGVLVLPHEEDIDPRASRDLRPEDRTSLRIVIWTGRLLEFRTFASGDRIPEDERVDNAAHQRIKANSPVQPGDLLRKRELDDYVARLNRNPARSVDTALSAAGEPGGVYLDFLVAENRPFNAYVQGSNTGTEQTTDWRERFGLSHNQLTGRDDILQLDYITGGFSEVHAVFGSYEAPIWSWDWLRARLGGAYSQYDASELGFLESRFEGEQWDVNTQFIANIWQWGDLFVDLFAGARFQRVRTDSQPIVGFPEADVTGESDFFLPELGMRVARVTRESTLRAAVSGEWNVAAIAGTDSSGLADMGRSFVDEENFELMRWNLFASFFLEPLVNRAAYDDPGTPRSSTLAHEIALSSSGQWAFDNRLVPAHERIAGGLHSVRGYEQSAVAGDSAALGRAEYRFHLPRALGIRPVPARLPLIGDFRVTPQQVYGLPDWDLILRGFFDAGRVWVSDRQPGEDHETLLGAGLGVELRFLSHLVVSFDWGRALREARGGELEKGNNEYHFVATLIY